MVVDRKWYAISCAAAATPWSANAPRKGVLALVAEGKSNAAVARQLVVSEAAVGKPIGNILAKLNLPPADESHRRVLAVLTFLRA